MTFVAIDAQGRPRLAPATLLEDAESTERAAAALARRSERLAKRRVAPTP